MTCDHIGDTIGVSWRACDFFGDLGESCFGVLRTTRLGVMRFAASDLPFLARMLFDSGEGFAGVPFTDPEANIEGMMNSGSTEFCCEPRRGDLRCAVDVGVRGECDSGSSDCRDVLMLRLGTGPAPVQGCAWSVLATSTTSADCEGACRSSSLSWMSRLSAPSLASPSDDTSALNNYGVSLDADISTFLKMCFCRAEGAFV